MRFIEENELKLTQIELFSFLYFKSAFLLLQDLYAIKKQQKKFG